ncbi:MAG TPA: DNA sulfur modification protein DndB [Candidatus Paceibacterota bacterium]|nr:DNA sulfur modification protein DndB [Candidatus Paceibacterota bacterium]
MALPDQEQFASTAIPAGYKRTDEFIGSETRQLGLRQMHLRLSLGDLTDWVERPDPDRRYEHNRRIDVRHAKDFAHYLLRGAKDTTSTHKYQPMIPGVSLFTDPEYVEFEASLVLPHEQFGTVRVDKHGRVQIWDGQHRILGMHMALEEVNEEIHEARSHLERANDLYESDTAEGKIIDEAQERYDELVKSREALLGISVPITLTLTSDDKRVAAIFSDLNDKQKGMSSSVVTRLDDRVVFNRVASDLRAHEYLEGLVDDERDTTTASNVNWISLRDLAAIAKLVWLGYGGRWNDTREDSVDDAEVYEKTSTFVELCAEVFPDLHQVLVDRTLEPKDLRGKGSNTSLLSSSTTIKALAVAYHDLLEGYGFAMAPNGRITRVEGLQPLSVTKIRDAFKTELPPMDSGEGELDDVWIKTGVFDEPFVAPTARGANVRTLAMKISEWIRGTNQ